MLYDLRKASPHGQAPIIEFNGEMDCEGNPQMGSIPMPRLTRRSSWHLCGQQRRLARLHQALTKKVRRNVREQSHCRSMAFARLSPSLIGVGSACELY
jgi:hypothetical protein